MRHILALSFLLPSLFIPAAANAMMPVDDASASAPEVRVSTGVTALPSRHQTNRRIQFNGCADLWKRRSGLTLTVDENGRPKNIQVVKSLSPLWGCSCRGSSQPLPYRPGSVDGQSIPVELNLTVSIAK